MTATAAKVAGAMVTGGEHGGGLELYIPALASGSVASGGTVSGLVAAFQPSAAAGARDVAPPPTSFYDAGLPSMGLAGAMNSDTLSPMAAAFFRMPQPGQLASNIEVGEVSLATHDAATEGAAPLLPVPTQ
jgi:hypothetical protein